MNNPPEKWRERLLAQGADPQSFLIMAKIIAQMMDVADKGIAPAGKQVLAGQAAIVNWGKAYQTSPHVMTQITRSFDPTMDLESPSEEFAIRPWLRDTMAKVKKITQKADRLTDKRTGLFTDDAMQTKELKAVMEIGQSQTGGFLVEIQVAI